MPTKNDKKSTTTTNNKLKQVACPNCCRLYTSLTKHYGQKPLCLAMQTDSSLVSAIPKKHNFTNQFTDNVWNTSNKKASCSPSTKQSSSTAKNTMPNLNTFDCYDLNDMDFSFFDINPIIIAEEDIKKEEKLSDYSKSTRTSSYNNTSVTSLTNDNKKGLQMITLALLGIPIQIMLRKQCITSLDNIIMWT